jgi:hypothetical protein
MTKKWIALNLVLLAFAVWAGWHLRQSILQFNVDNNPAKIQPDRDMKQKIVQDKTPAKAVPARNYNAAEYTIIPERNLFSESRSKEDKVAENIAPPEPPPLVQKPVLVGVSIADNQPKALIIDPTAPQQPARDANRRAQTKRIGDVYQGYTITEISPNQIVLESGTRKEVIPLREGTKRNQQGKTPILSTRIVAFGSGGISGGAPVSAGGSPGGSSVPVTPRTTVTSVGSGPATGQPGSVQTSAPNRAAQPSAQPGQAPPQNPAGDAPVRVIRTPFGDISRPAR